MALKIGIGGNSGRGGGGASSADKVSYDNTTSGLQSTNVQDAIDEVGANLGEYESKVDSLMDRADLVSVQAENVGYQGAVEGATNAKGAIDRIANMITDPKITNVFNPANTEDNKWVNYALGTIRDVDGVFATDYISVNPGDYIMMSDGVDSSSYSSNSSSFYWYDANKQKKAQGLGQWLQGTIRQVPNDCYYIRFSNTIEKKQKVMLLSSNIEFIKPSEYISYGNYKGGDVAFYGATFVSNANPLFAKKFVSICDSLGNLNRWEKRFELVSGATRVASFSQGGTNSIPRGDASIKDAQQRTLEFVNANIECDAVIIENINDIHFSSRVDDASVIYGTINDESFFCEERVLSRQTQPNPTIARQEFANNFETIINSFTTHRHGNVFMYHLSGSTIGYNFYFVGYTESDWTDITKWTDTYPTLFSCYKGIIEKIQSKYPMAKIYWWTPPLYNGLPFESPSADMLTEDGKLSSAKILESSWNNYYFKRMKLLKEIGREVCELYGVKYIDLTLNCPQSIVNASTYINSGDVHPKEYTYKLWADCIFNQIV